MHELPVTENILEIALRHATNAHASRITDWLPGRAHDALNRLLTRHTISTRKLFTQIMQWAKRWGSG